MSELKQQPGTVYPDEYDWKGEQGFGALNTLQPFTKCDTGKVLGLALAYEQLQAENKRYIDALKKIDKHEIKVMYERCPDCWSASLGCKEKGYCVDFTGKGRTTVIQDIIKQALENDND